MTSDPKTQGPRVSFEDVGKKLDSKVGDLSRRVAEESEKAVAYMNSEVVPAIRNGSSKALREAAQRLQQLADYLEKTRREQEQAGDASKTDPGNPSPS